MFRGKINGERERKNGEENTFDIVKRETNATFRATRRMFHTKGGKKTKRERERERESEKATLKIGIVRNNCIKRI